ncbi:AMP-binding protein, partial [Bacillus anthracis]|uniref:AMP-binding protein n=14 Tax=Bacillaceae TaxID=186817 RepID=UPI00301C7732
RYVNAYGPTETSICATVWEPKEGDIEGGIISIGQPIRNTQIYILSNEGHLQPVGVPGEMYIGGVGVAHGYIGREELTAQKFVSSSFSPNVLYRTGD